MNNSTHRTAAIQTPIPRPFSLSNSNGKEKDYESGFHYYGARYYWSEVLTGWLSVDPMIDKYTSMSPYAYCLWNPIRLVDPDGRAANPVYNKEGDFIGNTKEGFTGEPLIMKKNDYDMMMALSGADDISELGVDDVASSGGITFGKAVEDGSLTGIAQTKIVANIVSKYDDPELTQNYGFNAVDFASKIKYDTDGSHVGYTNFATVRSKSGIFPTMFYFRYNNKNYEFTVENITSSLVYHEWFGHDVMGYGRPNQMATASDGGTHYACFLSVMTSPIWRRTTPSYQEFNQTMFNAFFR